MKSRLFASALVLVALLGIAVTTGCSKPQVSFPKVTTGSDDTSASASATATAQLGRETTVTVGELKSGFESKGLKVTNVDHKGAGIFRPAKLTVLNVDGNNVQVYQFRDASQAHGAARTVDKDGFVVGYTPDQLITLNWAGWPAFFRSGNMIVVLITAKGAQANRARDDRIFNALVDVMGPQFTGGQVAPPSLSNIETGTVATSSAQTPVAQ